jgi:23S rRNA (cytidine1920-2'-O)/16S rRNA (cytidine1409-2'-O)-methyltransferase
VVRRARLDAELVRRGLARSREQAADVIAAGRVRVAGQVATKAATAVEPGAALVVVGTPGEEWASRGAHKLLGALAAFADHGGVPIEGLRCLDAGASTGGFTDVLLRRGAREVVAVDVGYGQLLWRVRSDERVTVFDRTNMRSLDATAIGGPVDLVVADLSFISLGLVLPALRASATDTAHYLLMVKPQFEVGRERLGPGGVVRLPELRKSAVRGVAAAAYEIELGVLGVTASPLPGPAGNVEYFLWLRAGAAALDDAALDAAVEAGPQ